jgi:hypothetical protein
MGICWVSCDALDIACRNAGATPVECVDAIPTSTHTCAGLEITVPSAYVTECTNQGGTVSGSSGGGGVCTKVCL